MGKRKETSDTGGDIPVPYMHSSLSIGLMPSGERFRSDIGGATTLDRQVSRPAVGTTEGQGGSKTILVGLRGCDEKVVVVETTIEVERKQRKTHDLFNTTKPGYIYSREYTLQNSYEERSVCQQGWQGPTFVLQVCQVYQTA